jgi:hypothetical protein
MPLDEIMSLGQVLVKSKFFNDTSDASQAIVKILAGQELGIGPIASMTGIHIVQGRVALGANLIAGQVKRSGKYDYRVTEMSDDRCEIAFMQSGQQIGVSTFTREDAKRAGTKNMDKFPRNMLFARAMSNGVRWYCPDIFSGPVYTPEELQQDSGAAYAPVVIDTPALPAPAPDDLAFNAPTPVVLTGTVTGTPELKPNGNGIWLQVHVADDAGEAHRVVYKASGDEWALLSTGDVLHAEGQPAENASGAFFRAQSLTISGMNAQQTRTCLLARDAAQMAEIA